MGIWQDLRQAVRVLSARPAFTALAAATLAPGIGANVAIVSVVNAVLLRPVTYRSADQLAMIGQRQADGSAGNGGYATFRDWRDDSRTFAAMAAMRSWNPTLTVNGEPERLSGARVTATYFGMLGVQPAMGRDLRVDEDRPE